MAPPAPPDPPAADPPATDPPATDPPATDPPATASPTVVRPLSEADVAAAEQVGWDALDVAGQRYGFSMGERDAERIRFAQGRVRHLLATDPDGAAVAERDGEIVGVTLALRRGSLWFLSLLAVRTDVQGGGVGRRLLEAALRTADDAERGMICASPDPKALRRYRRAGFALHATLEGKGTPDRAALPAGLGVREGDWAADADLAEQLVAGRRGEPYGPDLAVGRDAGARLLVLDGGSPQDRAVACVRSGGIGPVAATSESAGRRVLTAAIAEGGDDVRVAYLTGNQQWAVDAALDAGLALRPTGALCTRGYAEPPAPYLPSGIFG